MNKRTIYRISIYHDDKRIEAIEFDDYLTAQTKMIEMKKENNNDLLIALFKVTENEETICSFPRHTLPSLEPHHFRKD